MRKSILHDKEALEKATKNSKSISESLGRLGLRAAGGNYVNFKKACEQYNIVYAIGVGDVNHARSFITIPLEKILVECSTYTNRVQLKKRLINNHLLLNYCYKCLMPPEWNGKSLSLQLDHINGIFNDNRLNNLRLLCPNCHSQTETFCGRKNSINKQIYDHRKDQSIKMSSETALETLSIFYQSIELFGRPNMAWCGKQLNISDNTISKRLRSLARCIP